VGRLILDTTILIAAERDEGDLEQAIGDDDDVAIAAITAAELLVGVELAGARRRARRAEFVEALLDTVVVEDYTLETAAAHAALLAFVKRSGTPRGAHDLMIAATAVATERAIVTTDERRFQHLPRVMVA
jgi:tRNA(fMet)-specific endonuclease VapC